MDSTSKKPIIPGSRRGFKGFLSEARAEMVKVTWPTPRETTRLTGVVLAVCCLVIGLLFGLSVVFDMVLNQILRGGK